MTNIYLGLDIWCNIFVYEKWQMDYTNIRVYLLKLSFIRTGITANWWCKVITDYIASRFSAYGIESTYQYFIRNRDWNCIVWRYLQKFRKLTLEKYK